MGHLCRVATLFLVSTIVLSSAAVAESPGAPIYQKHCAKCHGEDGRAKTTAASKMKVANLRSPEIQSQSDAQLYDSIAYGKKHKQYPHAFLYTGLTEQDIRAVVAHIRTFK